MKYRRFTTKPSMMMTKERTFHNPTVHIPPWPIIIDDPTLTNAHELYADVDLDVEEVNGSDYFRMFEFKVRKCTRGRSHDWTECPFMHPGEKARRRDPLKFRYSGTACPEFRKGSCKKGDLCEFSHGVFECWLHPSRYRTQPCKDGPNCPRAVCFFAHSPDQLRVLSPKSPFSPHKLSPRPLSPPTLSLRQLHLSKAKSMPQCPLGAQMSLSPPGYGSPRFGIPKPGFFSLPTTPTVGSDGVKIRPLDLFDEEVVMERVESGRDLRAKMFERLGRENFLDRVDMDPQPDFGWVSDLLK